MKERIDDSWTTCRVTKKRSFRSRRAARKQRNKTNRKHGNIYLCIYCNGYHLGHNGNRSRAWHRRIKQNNARYDVYRHPHEWGLRLEWVEKLSHYRYYALWYESKTGVFYLAIDHCAHENKVFYALTIDDLYKCHSADQAMFYVTSSDVPINREEMVYLRKKISTSFARKALIGASTKISPNAAH